MPNRIRKAACLLQSQAEVVVRFSVIRNLLPGLPELGNGLIVQTFAAQFGPLLE